MLIFHSRQDHSFSLRKFILPTTEMMRFIVAIALVAASLVSAVSVILLFIALDLNLRLSRRTILSWSETVP